MRVKDHNEPVLERLGFYQQILGLDATALEVDVPISLPSLTVLSFHHTPPSCFRPFISLLDIPRFNDLTIALDEPQWSEDENASDLLLQLQDPFIAHQLRKLSIQSLAHPCDTAFFASFPALDTLGLDFSLTALTKEYWVALVFLWLANQIDAAVDQVGSVAQDVEELPRAIFISHFHEQPHKPQQSELEVDAERLRWGGDPTNLCDFADSLTAEQHEFYDRIIQISTMDDPPPIHIDSRAGRRSKVLIKG
ncbi:hypothetical protein B0H14DRAFT_3762920 [Mycena olivaceomarginata]|nr:hypothetical protein B0H14DRAFT_3762920 [Mycena olivaceomarginata]